MNTRPATLDDVPALLELNRAADLVDRFPYEPTAEEWQEDLTRPHTDLERDSRVVEDDGALVAVARVYNMPSEERLVRSFVYGLVHPEYRGRGIGTELVEWQVGRASEILAEAPAHLPRVIRTWLEEWWEDARELYAAHGFEEVRWFEEMVRDLAEPIPDVALPEALELVGWDDDLSEAVRRVHNEAFSDHWGSTDLSPEEWEHRRTEHGMRPDLHLLVMDGDRVAAYLTSGVFPEDWERQGRKTGWVNTLGVAKAYRKQGIASFLLAEAMRRYQAEGLTHSALVVDYESETGATRLYRSMGYDTLHRSVTMQRAIPD